MLAQANVVVNDMQSGRGQMQWKRKVCRWQWRVQPRRGSRMNCEGKKRYGVLLEIDVSEEV